MRVHITTAYDGDAAFAADWMKEAAKEDVHGKHHLTERVQEADIIIFCETHLAHDEFYERVYWHPTARRYPEKTFLYHDHDYACPLMPGVYPSIRSRELKWCDARAGVYWARVTENDAVNESALAPTCDHQYLFSFWGANNNPLRNAILALSDPRGSLRDTSDTRYWLLSPGEKYLFEKAYVDVLRKTKFALCPRGVGPSTYRLYEAMQLGVTPVIISDDWVQPLYIPWEDFAVRIPEREVGSIAQILSSLSAEYNGSAARLAWENYVSRPHCFHYLVEACLDISTRRRSPRHGWAIADYGALMRCGYSAHYAKWLFRRLKHMIINK